MTLDRKTILGMMARAGMGGGVQELNLTCPAITPALGAELVTNGSMEAGTPPSSWSLVVGTAASVADERTGGSGTKSYGLNPSGAATGRAHQILAAASAGTWLRFSGWGKKVTNSNAELAHTTSANVAISSASATGLAWGSVLFSSRVSGANDRVRIGTSTIVITDEARFDDISVKPLTFSSLIVRLGSHSQKNGTYTCKPTASAGSQCGILIEYLDENNFVLVNINLTDNTAKLISRIAGTYTSVISGAITYGAEKVLKCIVNGQNHSLYYDNIQVGTTQAVNNSGMGLEVYGFSTLASNSVGLVTTSGAVS
jgi:hypothetical protein